MTTQFIITIIIIGLMAGILSGLVGVGGGIIIVPALIFFLKYTQHQAQGTSLGILTFPVVILAFLHYYWSSKNTPAPIDMKVIAFMAFAFIIGGFIGGKLAWTIDQAILKKIFAFVLFFSAFKLLGWDVAILNIVKKVIYK